MNWLSRGTSSAVDDWLASRRVARCPAWFCFFLLDAVAHGEQGFGALVPPHGLARGCTAALAQGCNVVLSLRTLELVVTRDAVVKGAAKIRNNSARKLQRVLGCCSVGSEVRYRIYLYLVVGY